MITQLQTPSSSSFAGALAACEDCALKSGTICARLDRGERAALHRLGRRRAIARGQTMLWQGEVPSSVANVVGGLFKLTASTSDGREQILGTVGPGAFIGRIDGKASAYSAVALAPAEICLFPREAFIDFAADHPAIGAEMLERALQDLDRARRWLLMLGRGSAIERVAALLLDFAEASPGPRHAFALSRGQMADLAGLTIETVSRQLGKLKAAGVIAVPERDIFEVRDADTLRAIAGEAPGNGPH